MFLQHDMSFKLHIYHLNYLNQDFDLFNFQGTMYLFLLYFSARLTKELGMAPGGEFRRAFLEARNVPGCIIQLGDRPIEVSSITIMLIFKILLSRYVKF
jgi:hypothetical protein